jgi:putative tryptophan/tyrosine transport system substrate-binding protein
VKRRDFIPLIGATAAWPLAARAQQSIPVIGFLSGRALASDVHLVAAFRQGLGETGYVEGQNVAIEFRWAEGRFERITQMAADLVGRNPSVIFAGGLDVEIRAVRGAISTIPLVLATASDPVELGLVASLNRPGGNATGVTVISAALWPKRLELLRGLVALAPGVALFVNPRDPNAELTAREVRAAAATLGLRLHLVTAMTERDFEAAFAEVRQERAAALMVTNNPLFNRRRDRIIALAAQDAVPAIYDRREYPADGGLMSYGASVVDQYRQSGMYVGRILKGAKPADLPFLQPTKFELVINLKTASTLGLTVPDRLLALADEVIE